MITENYVSFETAKLLKEKGFDEKCFYCFDDVIGESRLSKLMICNNSELVEHYYSAPTLQMAMKWLREVHNIALNVCYFLGMWVYSVYRTDVWNSGFISEDFDTYEEAAEAGIRHCLENLI